MAERVHPQRAFWVFKKRARSKGLGGCGLCDHEACGPFPAVFSQQKVCLVRTSVCLCVCRMKASGLWENNWLHTAICIFWVTPFFFFNCQSISKQFYVLFMSCWSYKAYEPTLVTICNTKRWSICSICVKMGKVIYYTELSYNSCCYVVKAHGQHALILTFT